MEASERIKICSSCNNREFNPQIGIVCSLTKEKPNFEDNCCNYSANLSQNAKEIAERYEPDESDRRISGWLAFFLWGGVGAGATISTILNLVEFFSEGYSAIMITLGILYSVILLATAIYTIIAFLRRESNAVALANTYIAMIFIDGIMLAIFGLISDDSSMLYDSLRKFVWAICWFVFLVVSNKVKVIIPREIRTYRVVEKALLIAYAIIATISTSYVVYVVKSGDVQAIFNSEAYMSTMIEECNKETPEDLGDGIIKQKFILEGKNIVVLYKLEFVHESEVPLDTWGPLIDEDRQATLEAIKSENDPFIDCCFKQGYNWVLRYTNATGQTLFHITITPEDYFKLK